MSREFELRIKEIKGILDPDKMAQGAFRVFESNTPIRSGNARSHTSVQKNVIAADYPYATRLDEGYSKQKPAGMTAPTMRWLQNYIKKNLGK